MRFINNLTVNNMKKQTMGDRLKLLRTEYRLSQADFAGLVGLSGVAISNIETGVAQNPYMNTLETISKTFGTTYEWLKDGKGEMLPNGRVELNQSQKEISTPWRDEAYASIKKQLEFLQVQYATLMEMAKNGQLGKYKTLNHNTGKSKDLRLGAAA